MTRWCVLSNAPAQQHNTPGCTSCLYCARPLPGTLTEVLCVSQKKVGVHLAADVHRGYWLLDLTAAFFIRLLSTSCAAEIGRVVEEGQTKQNGPTKDIQYQNK